MKTANQSENVSNGLIAAWYVAGVLFLGCPLSSKAIESVGPSADAVKEAAPAATFSSGLADIVKMVDAKVDPEVIKTYIKSAPTAYNPSATEIIALKDHGVGPEVLTAMLQRGAELRAQAMRPSPTVPNSAGPQAIPGAANPYAPVYDYGAQPVYQTFTDPSPLYVSPSYAYAYPVYYGGYDCGYSWPWYWPSFYFGCGYRGSWGHTYCSTGYRYPYSYCYNGHGTGPYYSGHGYYHGGAYYGNRGYYGGGNVYGGRGYANFGARTAPYTVHNGGFSRAGIGGRPPGFTGSGAGFRTSGGFRGTPAPIGGRPGGFTGSGAGMRAGGGFRGSPASFGGGHAGGGGGRAMGRGR